MRGDSAVHKTLHWVSITLGGAEACIRPASMRLTNSCYRVVKTVFWLQLFHSENGKIVKVMLYLVYFTDPKNVNGLCV